MKPHIFTFGVLTLLFASCVNDGTPSKVGISARYGACGSAELQKTAADSALVLKYDSTGAVIFRSADSLQVAFLADMGCAAEHSEAYSLENDSTLKVEWTYSSSGAVAGCACRKVVTVSASSKEVPLTRIDRVDFNGLYVGF